MALFNQIITIALCAVATMITRFLPFVIFSENKKTPAFIQYLGKYLPSAVFGILVIYCLRDVNILQTSHGIPELIAIVSTVLFHLWKRKTLLSIAGGTLVYMLLINFAF